MGRYSWPERARLRAERDEPLLRPVVQVSLQPPAFLIARADDPGPRSAQLANPRVQFSRQPFVLEGDPGSGDDRVEQLALLCQRRAVGDRGDTLTVLFDHGHEPVVIVSGQLEPA